LVSAAPRTSSPPSITAAPDYRCPSNDDYTLRRGALDFVNTVGGKEQHDTAMWDVNVVTKKVLYRNKNAKYFSWIPSD
jgi:hypothetical protein